MWFGYKSVEDGPTMRYRYEKVYPMCTAGQTPDANIAKTTDKVFAYCKTSTGALSKEEQPAVDHYGIVMNRLQSNDPGHYEIPKEVYDPAQYKGCDPAANVWPTDGAFWTAENTKDGNNHCRVYSNVLSRMLAKGVPATHAASYIQSTDLTPHGGWR